MDIDIDFQPGFDMRKLIPSAIAASRVDKGELIKHSSGHYFQTIPVDGVTGFSAIPFEEAEVLGFFKIDCLKLYALDKFVSKAEIRELIKHEPDWDLLLVQENVEKLSQIGRQATLLKKIRPRSVQELADCLALMRPGKAIMQSRYLQNKNDPSFRKELYAETPDGYRFKRAHAIAYALTIVIQMHLMAAGVL